MFDDRSGIDQGWIDRLAEVARAEAPKPSVYFIGWEGGPIKIGWTGRDLKHRFHQIQAHCPYDLKILAARPGPKELELAYHRRFADWRMRGEWFERNWLLLNEIGKLTKAVRGLPMLFPPRPRRKLGVADAPMTNTVTAGLETECPRDRHDHT